MKLHTTKHKWLRSHAKTHRLSQYWQKHTHKQTDKQTTNIHTIALKRHNNEQKINGLQLSYLDHTHGSQMKY